VTREDLAKPSPLTSPANATEAPLRSFAGSPKNLNPFVPFRLDVMETIIQVQAKIDVAAKIETPCQ
jgi:hypothetical protein